MGTSTNYNGSSNWSSTKSEVTQAGGGGLITPDKASSIVGGLVDQMVNASQLGFGPPHLPASSGSNGMSNEGDGGSGGAESSKSGTGAGRGGGWVSTRIRSSARSIAQGIGSFLSDVATKGFREALSDRGLTNLIGKSADEIALALADVLGGPSSLVEETALRDALMALVLEWSLDAQGEDGLAERTQQVAENIEVALHTFLGHYIFEVFKTVGYQGILKTHGFERAERLTGQIRDFIKAKISSIESSRSLTTIDWKGPEGAKIVDQIVENTQSVFGDEHET